MGSFDETCAISGLTICYQTPVKLVFLQESHKGLVERGCYHNDYYSLKTPPISGVYNDYGKCEFEESYLTKLIELHFADELIEKPFGFNRYHDTPVPENANIHQLLEAAWEGRLEVGKAKNEEICSPNWKEVEKILKDAGLVLLEKNKDGYRVQQVKDGVVCVDYDSFENSEKELQKANDMLKDYFQCNLVNSDSFQKSVLMVSCKDQGVFYDNFKKSHENCLTRHPQRPYQPENSKIYSVMIRQDVWDVYSKVKTLDFIDRPINAEGLIAKHMNFLEKNEIMAIQEVFPSIFMCFDLNDYIAHLVGNDLEDAEKEDLKAVLVETLKIELILSRMHKAWHPPSLSGQTTIWNEHKFINEEIGKIIDLEIQNEKDEFDV